MVYIAILSLISGVICGQWIFTEQIQYIFSGISEYALLILMFSVGISVGGNKQVFKKIKEYHIKILIIPFGIITATILAGFICGLIMDMPFRESVSIVSGLGWYSLSGVLLTELANAEVGAIAFLSNLFREIIAFLIIPFIARKFNYYTAIAPAAATSEDTTLPMLIKYTNEEVVVMGVFNGVICSAAVPLLIHFFHSIL